MTPNASRDLSLRRRAAFVPAALLAGLVSGCVVVPVGPSVHVLPGHGKSIGQFQSDQLNCRSLASNQTHSAGLMDQFAMQRFFDDMYVRCMTAAGHQVPGYMTSAPMPTGPDPALVRAIQNELLRLGLLNEAPDGAYGGRTRAAIIAFEQANGLPATGAATQRVLSRMQASAGGGSPGFVAPAGAAGPASGAPSSWVAPTTRAAPGGEAPASGAPGAGPAPGAAPEAAPAWVAPTKPN